MHYDYCIVFQKRKPMIFKCSIRIRFFFNIDVLYVCICSAETLRPNNEHVLICSFDYFGSVRSSRVGLWFGPTLMLG